MSSPPRHLDVVAWLLVVAVFVSDRQYPAGYAFSLLYTGIILLALWTRTSGLALQLAGAGTALSVVAHFQAPQGADAHVDIFNRSVGIFVLWVAASGVTTYRRTATQREAMQRRALDEMEARLQTEEALRLADRSLRDVTDALDQAMIVATTNVQGDITYVNDKFCEVSQYRRDELIGQNHRLLNSGSHSAEFFREMYGSIASGRVWRGDIRNRAKDGSFYWVDTTIVPFLDERGQPYQYIALRYDITERKRAEAILRDQTALAQIGKMAAVVAHEVRNPLAGIRGAMQVIGGRFAPGSQEHAVSGEIITRIDALDEIVQDLLVFARPRPAVLAPVALDDVVRETISLLRQDPTVSGLKIGVDVDGAAVTADRGQLVQVLLNLLINGAQAMHDRGEISVVGRRAGAWQELRIHDAGPGLSAEVREHLFEPFFSTKHRGTGLGLATARRIVDAHGGTLDLESPPSGGTVAVLRLPATIN